MSERTIESEASDSASTDLLCGQEPVISLTCPDCGEEFSGYEHEHGDICFECYVDKSGMPT